MKYFYILFALAFLASCSTAETEVSPEVSNTTVEQTTLNELDSEMSELPSEESVENTDISASSEIQILQAPYTNPAGPVDMQVAYTLDTAGKIEAIDISATTYDLSQYNEAMQSVVGMTLAEASEYSVSGSSLTGAAFRAAVK